MQEFQGEIETGRLYLYTGGAEGGEGGVRIAE